MTVTEINSPCVPRKPLSSYKLVSFDIYGTLVDCESGTLKHLAFLQDLLRSSHPLKTDNAKLYRAWDDVEQVLKDTQPKTPYNEILAQSLKLLTRRELSLGTDQVSEKDLDARAAAFGDSVREWKAFPDTVPALKQLRAMGVKLVPVSNITNALFETTKEGALESFEFDAVFTAQDIGSYKPDLRNFEYLFSKSESMFGVRKEDILHVAHGLLADHEPAKKVGLQSIWIERPDSACEMREEAENGLQDGKWAYGWVAPTLGDLAEAMRETK